MEHMWLKCAEGYDSNYDYYIDHNPMDINKATCLWQYLIFLLVFSFGTTKFISSSILFIGVLCNAHLPYEEIQSNRVEKHKLKESGLS